MSTAPVQPRTALDLITQAKWESALFGTYALSLSFFESSLLKEGLIRHGCRSIDVVADVEGYSASLSERKSSRVGIEYRLIPAAQEGGIFHPKITLLSGPSGNFLLIGSGNLTHGGFGRNLEVLEIVSLEIQPSLYPQLRLLFESLGQRPKIRFGENDWLSRWVAWCEQKGGSVQDDGAFPRLVHSTIQPAADQLVAEAKRHGVVAELRVLSPFFDPDGDGILTFAERLGAQRLVVGLPEGREELSSFPFSKHRQTKVTILAATVIAPAPDRRLHAKWFELVFEDGHRLVLTGSVNATRKSLISADNIEIGLLRREAGDAASPLAWTRCATPKKHVPCAFFANAGKGVAIIHSTLQMPKEIRGTILMKGTVEGRWEGTLEWPDGTQLTVKVDADVDGNFHTVVPFSGQEASFTSLQLQLLQVSTGLFARGWVQNETLLEVGRKGFISASSLSRIVAGTSGMEDDIELFTNLTSKIHDLLAVFSESPSSVLPSKSSTDGAPEGGNEDPNQNRIVDLAELTPGSRRLVQPHYSVPGSSEDGEILVKLMRLLRRSLLRNESAPAAAGGSSSDESAELENPNNNEEASNTAQKRKQQRMLDALSVFERRLIEIIDAASPGNERGSAFVMWLEIALPPRVKRLPERVEAINFLRQWFFAVTETQHASHGPTGLAEYVAAVGLYLTLTLIARTSVESAERRRGIAMIHERLCAYFQAELTEDLLRSVNVSEQHWPPILTILLGELPPKHGVSFGLSNLLASPTIEQQLKLVESAVRGRTPLPPGLSLASCRFGKEFLKEAERGRRPSAQRALANSTTCPACHLRMSAESIAELSSVRFSQCSNCGKYLYATT
ncbi:MAG: hypothetical protein HZA31_08415 [Opitutae bacterium]|nr:hypothetical protein [Opitutae bacterium]